MIALLLQKYGKVYSGYFLSSFPQFVKQNAMVFLLYPPIPPHIFQTANMFFIATWDAFETSGWMALHHTKIPTGLNKLLGYLPRLTRKLYRVNDFIISF